jgi:signal transduction histidine kinase
MDRVSICLLTAYGFTFAAALAERLGFIRRLTAAAAGDPTHPTSAEEEVIRLQRMAALGERMGVYAHELASPIGAGQAVATTLMNACDKVRDGQETIDQVADVVGEACRLLKDNMGRAHDLTSRLKAEVSELANEEAVQTDLCRLINDLADTQRLGLKRTGYRIQVDCPTVLLVTTIPAYLTQILTNLIENAIRHGFAGRDAGTVSVDAVHDEEARTVAIHVCDDGIGIDPRARKRVFDRYFTTDRGQGGTGLGMYIVRTLAKRINATVQLESTPGHGTTVTVVLRDSCDRSA